METKSRIIQQAALLFLRYGLKSVSMDDIARELGVSKKTLYQSVENKADLVDQIISLHIESEKKMIKAIGKQAKDAIEELLLIAKHVTQMLRQTSPTVAYDLQKYYRKSWKLVETFNSNFIYDKIRKNINQGIEEGIYRKDINPDIIAKLYVGKTALVVDEDLFPLQEYNKENLFKQYISYHIHGIASPKGMKLLEKHTKTES